MRGIAHRGSGWVTTKASRPAWLAATARDSHSVVGHPRPSRLSHGDASWRILPPTNRCGTADV